MTLKLRDGVSTADTEYGTVLLDEDGDQYWTLNPTGAIVVRTILDGGTPADAAQELTQQYAVDFDSASQDVQELVSELCSAGLVEKHTTRPPGRRRMRAWRSKRRAP